MTDTVAVVAAESVAQARARAGRALAAGADLVEFRIDFLRGASLDEMRALARDFGARAIATLRSPEEGGAPSPLHRRRGEVLRDLCTSGFGFVDLELEADARRWDALREAAAHRSRIIASYHAAGFPGIEEVASRIHEACARGDIGKVAVRVPDLDSARALVTLGGDLGRKGRRFCLIGLGALGAITRVLADEAPQALQYVAANGSVVDGQLSLATALRIRGKPKIVAGLVGHPLGHSLSPSLHEAAFEASRLPGTYLPFDVERGELAAVFEHAEDFGLRGFNVTIPYKETVFDFLDEVDPIAEAVGAVNTVHFQGGRALGFNTDVFGFERTLEERSVAVDGRRVLVVGAGGAARAVTYSLVRARADVAVWNRTRERADALAAHFGGRPRVVVDDEVASSRFDIVVNATPSGMAGFAQESPVPPPVWDHARVAVDLVYNPVDTAFLREARAHGADPIGGLDVLVFQAARTFEILVGKPAPLDAMFRAAKEALP